MVDFTKRFSVLGAGKSALAAASRLTSLGAMVFVSDSCSKSSLQLEKLGFEFETGGHTAKVLEGDYLVVSPGIRLDIPIIKQAKAQGIKVLSEVELGFLLKPAKTKVIAVTGTNGKSTVVSLIKHILDVGKVRAALAGNIGVPLTSYDLAKENLDYLVLELSSFQLELLDTFKAETALLLNTTCDHLDRYASFGEYVAAKKNIFNHQTPQDKAITSTTIKNLDLKAKTSFVEDFLDGQTIRAAGFSFVNNNPNLLGKHNLTNIAFGVLATIDIVQPSLIQEAIKSFQPLSHRLEVCLVRDDVTYVNDSKATTIDSCLCALDSFSQEVILILGGSDKGEDFSHLLSKLQEKTKKMIIGKIYFFKLSRSNSKATQIAINESTTQTNCLVNLNI